MVNRQGCKQQIDHIKQRSTLPLTIGSGSLWQQKLESCTVPGRGGVVVHWEQIVVSLALHSCLVSLSHCALLACTAEEAPQHTEAVHHHQSLCSAWVYVCLVCESPTRPCRLPSNEKTLQQQQILFKSPVVPK